MYHCIYDVVSHKWSFMPNFYPWIRWVYRSFHMAIHFWW